MNTLSERIAELPPLEIPYDYYSDIITKVYEKTEIRFKEIKKLNNYYLDKDLYKDLYIVEYYVVNNNENPYIFRIEFTKKNFKIDIENDKNIRLKVWNRYNTPASEIKKPMLYSNIRKLKRPSTPIAFKPSNRKLDKDLDLNDLSLDSQFSRPPLPKLQYLQHQLHLKPRLQPSLQCDIQCDIQSQNEYQKMESPVQKFTSSNDKSDSLLLPKDKRTPKVGFSDLLDYINNCFN